MERWSTWMVLAGLVACSDPTVAITTQASTVCPTPWECLSNDPEVDIYNFHDLSFDGTPNSAGISIHTYKGRAQFWDRNNSEYELGMKNNRLVANKDGGEIGGQDLVDGWFMLEVKGHPRYKIIITTVNERTTTVEPRTPFEAYHLQWDFLDSPPNPERNVCSHPPPDPDDKSPDGLYGLKPDETMFFRGDRINADRKTFEGYDENWFNIACSGHALAKLALVHQTTTTRRPGEPIDVERYQATLKMYVADYCGSGTAFTVSGQRLVWTDPFLEYGAIPWKLEARWNELGAECLYYPRRFDDDPNIVNEIMSVCGFLPPECTYPDAVHDFQGNLLISAVPQPP